MPRKGENITKRKDGRWEARIIKGYECNGKAQYAYLYGRTYSEAKEKKFAFIRHSDEKKRQNGEILLNSVLSEFLLYHQNKSKESTVSQYKRIIDMHIRPQLGNLQLQEITPFQIESFTHYKGYRKNGNEEHIINGNRYDTTCYHKEQSRSASNRELFFFACFLQGSSHSFKLKQDAVLLFLTSRRQSLVFEGLLFVEQFIYILIDLFWCQLQKCECCYNKQNEADNIECCHTQ